MRPDRAADAAAVRRPAMVGPPPGLQLRATGYGDVLFRQWAGTKSTVYVVSEDRGSVICRYESGGQTRHFGAELERVIFKPRAPDLPGRRSAAGFIQSDRSPR